MISLLSMQTFLGVDRIPDLHVLKSGFRKQKFFVCGIRNQGIFWQWNPESWAFESGL